MRSRGGCIFRKRAVVKLLACSLLLLLVPFRAKAETKGTVSDREEETVSPDSLESYFMNLELTPAEEEQLKKEILEQMQQEAFPESQETYRQGADSQGLPAFYTSSADISMEQGAYCYEFPGGVRLLMSIPNGGVSFGPVSLDFPDGDLGISTIEIDGVPDYNLMEKRFEKEGTYQLSLFFLTEHAGERLAGYKIPITFRIGKKLDRETESISAPEGFRIRSVKRSGIPVEISGDILELTEDGTYEIAFVAKKNPEVSQEISFTMDREAPALSFSSPVDTEGKVKPPLTITVTESDSKVRIIRDTLEYAQFQETLTEGGRYRIIVSDPAGNSREYRFVMAKDHSRAIRTGIIITAIALLGIIGYMVFLRRHMEVL